MPHDESTPEAGNETPTTIDDWASLIAALGGQTAVARAIGIKPGLVLAWAHRNSIVSRHWPALIALAQQRELRGITAHRMLELEQVSSERREVRKSRARQVVKEPAA